MKTRLSFVSNSSSSSYIIAAEDNVHLMVLSDPEVLTLSELVKRFGGRLFFPYYDPTEVCMSPVPDSKFIELFLAGTTHTTAQSQVDPAMWTELWHIPMSAARAFDICMSLDKQKLTDGMLAELKSSIYGCEAGDYSSPVDDMYFKLRESARAAAVDACFNVLKTKLGKMRFCYQEIEDTYRGSDTAEDPFKLSVDPDTKRHGYTVEDVAASRKNLVFYENGDVLQPNDECLVQARIQLLEKLKGPFKFKRVFSNH